MAKKKAKSVKKVAGKKTVAKKAPKKKVTSLAKGRSKKPVAKRSTSSKGKKRTSVTTKASDKERNEKKANAITNSEKSLSAGKAGRAVKKRVKVTTSKETNGLLDSIIDGMQEKKAKNITVLDLHNIENRIADYFVICDADSGTHVDAIADSIEEIVLKQTGEKPYHSEGQQNSEWILIDYINIVVHVFLRETREYYNIEGLWGDAEIRTIN